MGIAQEYLTRLAKLYREAEADNAKYDYDKRQRHIDNLKGKD